MNTQISPTIFGIDLGTTYSCIAYIDEFGQADVIATAEGDLTLPSVVLFENDGRIVGKEAKNSAVLNPEATIEMVKRYMGEVGWRFKYRNISYTAEEISSYILRKLAHEAERSLGYAVKDVVITCPAYFGISQRDATIKAGEIAGFNVRDIINEPTAAAIIYGLQNERDQTVLVYDLGGGTFDTTVIEIRGGAFTVISTGGNYKLGGRDWDEAILVYLAEQWMKESGMADDPTDSLETLQDLWGRAEMAKQALTVRQETRVIVSHKGRPLGITLTRAKFDELTAHLLEQTIKSTRSTLTDAGARGFEKIDQILLVGGSTKMPQVAARLQKEFELPIRFHEPDTAVAKGAALYAQKLSLDEKLQIRIAAITSMPVDTVNMDDVPAQVMEEAQETIAQDSGLRVDAVKKLSEMEITNVTSHSFGVIVKDSQTGPEYISNILMLNDPLPAIKSKRYGTLQVDQEVIEIKVLENSIFAHRVDDTSKGQEIGKVLLHLPPRLPLNAPIEVSFELQKDGRLHITAHDLTRDASIEVDIQTRHGLTQQEQTEAKKRRSRLIIS